MGQEDIGVKYNGYVLDLTTASSFIMKRNLGRAVLKLNRTCFREFSMKRTGLARGSVGKCTLLGKPSDPSSIPATLVKAGEN